MATDATAAEPMNLEQLLADPSKLPDDFAAVSRMLEDDVDASDEHDDDDEVSLEAAEEGDGEQSEEEVTDDQTETDETQQAKGESKEDDGEEQEAPIASKDGKHQIPYSVLQTERERRQTAERATQELQDRLKSLEAAAKRGDTQAPETSEDDLTDEALDALAQEFPAVGKLLKQTRTMQDRLDALDRREQERQAKAAETQRQEAQEAIDQIPKLLYLQQHREKDPVAEAYWQAALQADQTLMGTAAGRKLTLDQRFEKALRIAEELHGTLELPAEFAGETVSNAPQPNETSGASPATKPTAPKASAPKKSPEALRTLSNLPGGRPPSSDPLEDMAALSSEQLGEKFANMTPEQINQVLARMA